MGFGCAERLPRFTTAPETKLLLLAVSTRRFDCVFSTSASDGGGGYYRPAGVYSIGVKPRIGWNEEEAQLCGFFSFA
jgi:hypothetical protein